VLELFFPCSLLIGCKKKWTFINVQKIISPRGSRCEKTHLKHYALKLIVEKIK
jgi:hypothetical protein